MNLLECDQKCSVIKVNAGDNAKRRLAALGIVPQADVEVIHKNAFGGPVMIRVKNSIYAIGKKLAAKIEVENYES